MTDVRRMPLRILHTSDLHLALLGDKACHSLETIVALATKARVDLVAIAGDLFDHHRIGDSLVSFVAEQLRSLPAYVAILPGNHDCLVPGSAFERVELWKDCANVRVFRALEGETLDLPGLEVSVWGKPVESYESNIRPLAGIPQNQSRGKWHITVAHGHYASNDADSSRSLRITHDEIINSRQDYIALGHWPSFSCICSEPVISYYCGSPPVTNTVAIVDLAEETGVQVTPYSL